MTQLLIDETHDPKRKSWVESADGHPDFPIQNLPLGVFSPPGGDARIGVAIGDLILDLRAAAALKRFDVIDGGALKARTLNALFGRPGSERRALRNALSSLLSDPSSQAMVGPWLYPAEACTLHLPAAIGDYTDFYVGIHHAENIGRLLRPDNPLLPNYKHVPIGYHGRASSVRPSGTKVLRPSGQRRAPDADRPDYGPTRRLDYELEMGVWIGPGNKLGDTIPIADAREHIAGFCLLNDWSARDLQAWEYQPLGPFLSKSFMTTISPWVVTIEALAPFFIAQTQRPAGDPRPQDYLWDDADQAGGALAISLEVSLSSADMRRNGLVPISLSKGSAASMYWTVSQIVTHHASNGCNLSPGDLLGTGTISGPDKSSFGSLMELSHNGVDPVAIPGGARTFLQDGDEVVLSAQAKATGFISIGFGACRGVVAPAR